MIEAIIVPAIACFAWGLVLGYWMGARMNQMTTTIKTLTDAAGVQVPCPEERCGQVRGMAIGPAYWCGNCVDGYVYLFPDAVREPCADEECHKTKGKVQWTGGPYLPSGDTQYVSHPDCGGKAWNASRAAVGQVEGVRWPE